jgi:gamma-glutamylcyclotransferase (GGCT)/AIG2-like uncharacterized protein YtfP
MKTHRLFTYGTLQSSWTMSRFCEREMAGTLARLADYERRLIPGMGFPFVVRMPGMLVEGVLYEGLTDEDIFALDRYESEGRLYDRLLENVLVVKTGERKLCYVYVPHGAMHDQVLKTGAPKEIWSEGLVGVRWSDGTLERAASWEDLEMILTGDGSLSRADIVQRARNWTGSTADMPELRGPAEGFFRRLEQAGLLTIDKP